MRAIVAIAVGTCVACSAPRPTQGPGTLIDRNRDGGLDPIDAGLNVELDVHFRVELPCGPGGPMFDLTSAAATVTAPDGGTKTIEPRWTTSDRVTYDCTQDQWQRVSDVEVTFTPDTIGTWHTEVVLEPKVGEFARDVIVH